MARKFDGEKLRRLRTEAGWSQVDIADAIGIKVQVWNRWERGKATPSGWFVAQIAHVLDVRDARDLFVDPAPREAAVA